MKSQLKYVVYRRLEETIGIFSNLQQYATYHPLIKSVEKCAPLDVQFDLYRIHEKPYHYLPITIRYKAKVTYKQGTIEYQISRIPFALPCISYQFDKESTEITQIDFTLNIKGRFIGKRILLNKMISAQNILINSINTNRTHYGKKNYF